MLMRRMCRIRTLDIYCSNINEEVIRTGQKLLMYNPTAMVTCK